jgi:hypothetical protein
MAAETSHQEMFVPNRRKVTTPFNRIQAVFGGLDEFDHDYGFGQIRVNLHRHGAILRALKRSRKARPS